MLTRIERQMPRLTNAEQSVARWVLAHPRQAVDATLAEVARACGVSEPTVIRFCRHVGLDGFREFSRRLAETLSRPVSYVHRDVGADDKIPDAVAKVLDASIQALVDAREQLATMPLETAVLKLLKSRQLVFAGLGASGIVAEDACHKFFRLGIPCSAMTSSPNILQFAAIAARDDTLLFVSALGAAGDTVAAARLAAERGACVIALTDPLSALAATANIVLGSDSREDTGLYTPMSSRLAHLAILDALHVSLALSLGEAATERLKASKAAISGGF